MSRPENQRMQEFLAANGIKAHAKFIWDGSLKGTWRLWDRHGQRWNPILADRLTALGFRDYDGRMLGNSSGNGGAFCVFVRGHSEFVGTERARTDFKELLVP